MNQVTTPKLYTTGRILFRGILVGIYLPLLFVLFKSIRNDDGELTLNAFKELLSNIEIGNALSLSFIVSIASSGLSVLIGFSIAFLAYKEKRFEKWILGLSYFSLAVPEILLALSAVSFFGFIMKVIPLEYGILTMVTSHFGLTLCYATLILFRYLNEVPISLIESAQDLGASAIQTFFRIVIPQIKIGILASFLVCFMLSLDDFLVSFFMGGVGRDTWPVLLYSSMKQGMKDSYRALGALFFVLGLGLSFLVYQLQKREYEKRIK